MNINYSYSIDDLILNEIDRMTSDGTHDPGHWTYSYNKETGDVELTQIKKLKKNLLTVNNHNILL